VVADREAKSVGVERTLALDARGFDAIAKLVDRHASEVAERLARHGRPGRTVTLKVRYSDFETLTCSRTLAAPTASAPRIAAVARELLRGLSMKRAVRLVGVSVSGLTPPGAPMQLELL
jgi:DNA polymerase-4